MPLDGDGDAERWFRGFLRGSISVVTSGLLMVCFFG